MKLVCIQCKADWNLGFNPGTCPACQKASCGIAVEGEPTKEEVKTE